MPPLRVAALQCDCSGKSTDANLAHIGDLLDRELAKLAPGRRPHLILLPELFSTGYNLDNADPDTWNRAEILQDGQNKDDSMKATSPTLDALVKWAKTYNAYFGGSLLEFVPNSDDFLNIFILVHPDGLLDPLRVPKSRPASFEAFVFTPGINPDSQSRVYSIPHPADGSQLKVGVAICYENLLPAVYSSLTTQERDLDLLLSPYCAPDPIPSFGFPWKDCDLFLASMNGISPLLAKSLGCYVLACNKTGPFETETSRVLPFMPRVFEKMQGVGFTAITKFCAPDGSTVSSLAKGQEGLLLAELDTSAPRPARTTVPTHNQGPYLLPEPLAVNVGFMVMETLGWLGYSLAGARRRRAGHVIREKAGLEVVATREPTSWARWIISGAVTVGILAYYLRTR